MTPSDTTPARQRRAAKRAPPRSGPDATAASSRKRDRGKIGNRKRRSSSFVGWLASAALFIAIIGFAVAGTSLYYFARDLPSTASLRIPKRAPSITVMSGDGEIMGRRGVVHAGVIGYEELPNHLIQAVVAIEDQRFFEHFGIDVQGLARAAYANFQAGRIVQGGSTLTQQLAKNLFLKPDRNYVRKIQEIILAIRLEREFSKQEILELYLNRVYLGAGTYGIAAASERYFEKSARDLTLSESALIAGLLKAPSKYSPTSDHDAAVKRAQVVLVNMASEGFITKEERFVAGQMLQLPRAQTNEFETAPFILDWVAESLPEVIGEAGGDLVVETSLDLNMQKIAEDAAARVIAENGEAKKVEEAAVVLMTNQGQVKALVGGLDYRASQFNRAVKALRQPGSTFKIFVYLAALEQGVTPWDMRVDQPIRIRDWEPKNYGNSYRGPVTIDEALTKSINTVAAQVADEIGIYSVIDVAHRLGIRQDLPESPSLALGTGEVTLLELTGALAPIANGGSAVTPHVISRVLSADGQVLYEAPDESGIRVLTPIQIADMNLMLSHVVQDGTGRRAALADHQAAGKTGTTQDYRDAWFVGYTGHYTAGVWVGNDDNSEMNKVTGGSLPAMIWQEVMTAANEGLEPVSLPMSEMQAPLPPPGMVSRSPLGSFLGGLFGFGSTPAPPTDPRFNNQYGYRYPPSGQAPAYPPYGGQPQGQVPPAAGQQAQQRGRWLLPPLNSSGQTESRRDRRNR